MTDTITQPKTDKIFIAMMASLMAVTAISIDAMMPVLGIIRESFETSHPNQVQLIISMMFAGMALGQLIFGPLSDALGRRKILFLTLGIYCIGSLVCLLATTIEAMLMGRVIQGLGAAGPYVCSISIVRDTYSGRAMARVMSLIMMIFVMVPVAAPAFGQAIVLVASWHYIFVFYLFYAVLIALWMFFRFKETLPPEKRVAFTWANIRKDVREVLTNRHTMCYTLAMGCLFGSLIGDLNSVQQIFQERYAVGKMFVVYFGLQALAFGVSSLFNARWVERYGMRYLCIRALLLFTFTSVVVLALHFVMDIGFWLFFFYGCIICLSVGLLFGNLNALAMEPMGHIAGLAAAVIGAVSNLVAIPAGTLIGQYYDGTIMPMTIGFTVLGALALLCVKLAQPSSAN